LQYIDEYYFLLNLYMDILSMAGDGEEEPLAVGKGGGDKLILRGCSSTGSTA
jgi:hypothetical protein